MGILDDLKHKAEELGDKAREGLDAARDKAGDLLDDAKDGLDSAKDRFGHHDEDGSPLSESSDVGPDTTSTDAMQPGYVAAEDDVTGTASDESSLTDDAADADEGEADDDVADDDGTVPVPDPVAEEESFAAEPAEPAEPAVATDVDPYDQPLTETIGDEISATPVDSDAVAEAVDGTSDRDA